MGLHYDRRRRHLAPIFARFQFPPDGKQIIQGKQEDAEGKKSNPAPIKEENQRMAFHPAEEKPPERDRREESEGEGKQ